MSSIVIAGDTSGSVTLQAPAVSGSTVLNLPSTSGTIQTSGAGYTTNGVAYATNATGLVTGSALVFDGTNLGIGTSSPSFPLHVQTNASGYALTLKGRNAGGNENWLQWTNFAGTTQAGMYATSDNLVFATSSSYTEGMRLTSTGLGIGTSSPRGILDLSRADSVNAVQLYLENTSTSEVGLRIRRNGSDIGFVGTAAWSITGGGSTNFGINAVNALLLGVGSTERARIISSGFFKASNSGSYIGSGSNYHELVSNFGDWILYSRNTNASPGGVTINHTTDANGTSNHFLYCSATAGETLRMSVRSNGGIANYSANNVNLSDRREKTNFSPAKSYLDKICAIPVQTFNYIDQNLEEDGGLTLGVVAQDVQAVAPELVMESNWASKDEEPKMRLSIYQTDLQYALMKCIQEQQALITTLTDRISVLENK